MNSSTADSGRGVKRRHDEDVLLLRSQDGVVVSCARSAARRSGMLRDCLSECGPSDHGIYVPISEQPLQFVVTLLEADAVTPAAFCRLSQPELFAVARAAKFLFAEIVSVNIALHLQVRARARAKARARIYNLTLC